MKHPLHEIVDTSYFKNSTKLSNRIGYHKQTTRHACKNGLHASKCNKGYICGMLF